LSPFTLESALTDASGGLILQVSGEGTGPGAALALFPKGLRP
jgi:hypothetical protein